MREVGTSTRRIATSFEQVLDADGLWDRVGSRSFIARLREPEHLQVREEVRALVGSEGTPQLWYTTEVFSYRLL